MDEDILVRLDRLAGQGPQGRTNRSLAIREAVREYVSRLERVAQDRQEAGVVRRHRGRLARQATALVRDQAKP